MYRANSKADLHVHSKYSDRPSEWFLRRIGAPECFVEPLQVYQRAKERGMDFVTISDHNSIRGACEIAHLEGVFISDEVTTYFPEDGCKVHCLVAGINPSQFEAIQELRENIYHLQQYLLQEDILHWVAHPLFSVNERLSVDHVEKLLVLFKRFEAINGSRDPRAAQLVQAVFAHLDAEMLQRMADRHDLIPAGDAPWEKWFTGGSDDHSGVYVAAAHTVTPYARSVDEFLGHLRRGNHEPAGSCGGSLVLGHSLCHIAYSYYKTRLLRADDGTSTIIGELLQRLLGESTAPKSGRLRQFVPGFAVEFMKQRRLRRSGAIEQNLVAEFSDIFQNPLRPDNDAAADSARKTFRKLTQIAQVLSYKFTRKSERYLREGRLLDSLQTIASLGPVALGVAPYLTSFATQHKDEALLRSVAAHFPAARHLQRRSDHKAWVTDTFVDVNGVARTLNALGAEAQKSGRQMTVITCLPKAPTVAIDLKNFAPVGRFPLPEYELLELCFPPFMEIIEYIERQQFEELIISTPGPLGLAALAAGRLLKIPTAGIYHTDFPLLVQHMTQDHLMEQLTWKYMHWFYSQVDDVGVPSEYYRNNLVENGFDPARLWIIGHGVDLRLFNPARRRADYWTHYGLNEPFTFLYVGRVSPDKNLECLLDSFRELRQRIPELNLAVVGDGPARAALQERYEDAHTVFTGFLKGEELAAGFASADALVFPSKTDTFGNVVLEAQASGLPVIVSDRGGPAEIARAHESGIILDVDQPHALTEAMQRMATDAQLRAALRERGLRNAAERSWARVLNDIWDRDRSRTRPVEPRRPAVPHPAPGAGLIAMDVA